MGRSQAVALALVLAFGLALTFGLRSLRAKGEPSAEPIDARAEPLQEPLTPAELRAPSPFRREGVVANAQARYRIAARVLARERYFFGWQSDVSPLDLALGWGAMSDPAVDRFISWRQGMRWYFYSWSEGSPYSSEDIARQSANVHIIPASTNLRRALLALDEGDVVRLDGYLVNVQGPDGEHWPTSLARDDRGDASCELLLVTSLLEEGASYR